MHCLLNSTEGSHRGIQLQYFKFILLSMNLTFRESIFSSVIMMFMQPN